MKSLTYKYEIFMITKSGKYFNRINGINKTAKCLNKNEICFKKCKENRRAINILQENATKKSHFTLCKLWKKKWNKQKRKENQRH